MRARNVSGEANDTQVLAPVNEVVDSRNLSDLEKMHLPVIGAPETMRIGTPTTVTVEVGRPPAYSNDRRHFIRFIELYADQTLLARLDLMGMTACPRVTFDISLDQPAKELRVVTVCDLHGAWMARKPITCVGE